MSQDPPDLGIDLRYNNWYKEVNQLFRNKMGLDLADIEDMAFRDMFDSDMTPEQALSQILYDMEDWDEDENE